MAALCRVLTAAILAILVTIAVVALKISGACVPPVFVAGMGTGAIIGAVEIDYGKRRK